MSLEGAFQAYEKGGEDALRLYLDKAAQNPGATEQELDEDTQEEGEEELEDHPNDQENDSEEHKK